MIFGKLKCLNYLWIKLITLIAFILLLFVGHDLITHINRLVKRVDKELHSHIKSSEHRTFTLDEQISHKIAFIQEYIINLRRKLY